MHDYLLTRACFCEAHDEANSFHLQIGWTGVESSEGGGRGKANYDQLHYRCGEDPRIPRGEGTRVQIIFAIRAQRKSNPKDVVQQEERRIRGGRAAALCSHQRKKKRALGKPRGTGERSAVFGPIL